MREWQPIETAPMNTLVWCYNEASDPQQFVAMCYKARYYVHDWRTGQIIRDKDDLSGCGFKTKEDTDFRWYMADLESPVSPTHWMPLPEPPYTPRPPSNSAPNQSPRTVVAGHPT